VVEQLVTGDPVDPTRRRLDPSTLLQLDDGGEEGLLRQIVGDRGGSSTAMQEVAVDARQRTVVEGAKRLGVKPEWRFCGGGWELHERDHQRRSLPNMSHGVIRFPVPPSPGR